jgi:dimethylamine monooxygenase subunit A
VSHLTLKPKEDMREICQSDLPVAPWMAEHTRRLPGLNLLQPGEWLLVDEVYAAQMAYRVELIATQRDAVHRLAETARPAAEELLDLVLENLRAMPGFRVGDADVVCPDGRIVAIDRARPLITCGHLVQEDFNIMQKHGDEHVLTASILCFPASWSLDEKFMRNMTSIHLPVGKYDAEIGTRVQRMFDRIQVDRPMWRANFLIYSNPDLFQPRREAERRKISAEPPHWVRSERQCLVKLPKTGAVVFSIHNYVLRLQELREDQRQSLLTVKGNEMFVAPSRQGV